MKSKPSLEDLLKEFIKYVSSALKSLRSTSKMRTVHMLFGSILFSPGRYGEELMFKEASAKLIRAKKVLEAMKAKINQIESTALIEDNEIKVAMTELLMADLDSEILKLLQYRHEYEVARRLEHLIHCSQTLLAALSYISKDT